MKVKRKSSKGQGWIAIGLCLTFVTIGSACRPERSGSLHESTTNSPHTAASWSFVPLNTLVHWSDAAVIGTVTEITQPRWNQDSGEPWEEDGKSKPWRYRDATVRVEQVLWSSNDVAATKGGDLVVRLYGDGSASGDEVGAAGGAVRYRNQQSGPIDRGATVLFVVMRTGFVWRGGTVDATVLVNHLYGNWTIRGDIAVSADPERTVPVDTLIRRLEAERARGADASDRRGNRNPLESEQPSADR